MFSTVLNKVISERLHKSKLFFIIDLLPSAKLLELLAINHSSSERMIIFCSLVVEVLPCSGMGAHFLAVELDNAIQISTLSTKAGFL